MNNKLKCKICNKELKNFRALSCHIAKQHKITLKQYYDEYLKQEGEGICPICGKETKFINTEIGYSKFCSISCNNKDPNFIKKVSEARKNRPQEEKKKTQEKRQNTCLEKYDNPYYNNHEQAIKTMTSKSKEEKEKIQEKRRKTNLEVHNDPNYNNREKFKKTWNNKSLEEKQEIVNKVKNTTIKNNSTEKRLKKLKSTMNKKYNVDSPLQNKEILNKCIETKKRNTELFEQENDCTSIQILIEKYGYGWFQANVITDYINYGYKKFVKNSDIYLIKEYAENNLMSSGTSHKEKEIVKYIKTIYSGEIIENTKKIISPLELDIYIPDKNLAIEFNGSYWHSTVAGISKTYHLKKSKLCEEKGIRLIHIYEWELEEPFWSKIKMMLNQALGNNPIIYARNCKIKEITNKEAEILNNKVHLQGHRNAQITYGLFYNDELVQLMSFSKTKYNRNLKGNNDWEIIRGCPGSNISVVGGVSKLFKHFIKMHNPNKIFSYCDFNKFDGSSYEKIGMKFIGYTGPDKTWLMDGYKPVKRNPKKYKELKQQAIAIMWGAGSKKYEWGCNY